MSVQMSSVLPAASVTCRGPGSMPNWRTSTPFGLRRIPFFCYKGKMTSIAGAIPPLNILVVDDEANIRKTLSVCLEAEGHQAVAVGNFQDAVSESSRRSFDLAFVDLRLGTSSGLDLIPALLASSPWLKIIVITAYASIDTAVEAMRRGATDYIPKPFWKTLWRKTTFERLIHEAKGLTVVILDTRKEEPSGIMAPEEEAGPPVAASSVPVSTGAPALSGFLSPERIVVWDRPAEKDTVLRTLAKAAVAGCGEVDLNLVLTNIAKREEQGSTFLNEGVALPHARIEGLLQPVVAIGLTRKGVSDVSTEKPIEYVFLVLSPAEAPETQIQILGQVSRSSRNRQLVQNLELCRTPAEVLTAFRDWETSQGASPRKTGITG